MEQVIAATIDESGDLPRTVGKQLRGEVGLESFTTRKFEFPTRPTLGHTRVRIWRRQNVIL